MDKLKKLISYTAPFDGLVASAISFIPVIIVINVAIEYSGVEFYKLAIFYICTRLSFKLSNYLEEKLEDE